MIKCNFIGFWVALFLLSCHSPSQEYYRYEMLENARWKSAYPVVISMDSLPVNPRKAYDILLEITHNNQYRYRDVWLGVDFFNISDSVYESEKMHILFADSTQKWQGSGVGGLHQLSVSYKKHFFLDSLKRYQIIVRQLMRDDPLVGIEKIGVKID